MTKTFKLSENLRRNIARFFLPILTVWLIVMPSQSYAVVLAVVPVVAIAAAADATLAGAGSVVAINAGMTAATGLITTMAAYFLLTYPDGSEHRIPTTTDPSKQVLPPVAPSSVNSVTNWEFFVPNATTGLDIVSNTPEGVCAAGGGTYLGFSGGSNNYCNFPCAVNIAGCTGSISGRSVLKRPSTNSCPAGYSGNPCALVDARAAAPDNKCDFGRSGGGFSMITDPDCAKNLNVKSNADGSLDFTGKDKYGRPVTVHFQPTPAGGTAVGITAQAADAAGNTVNTNLNLNVNPAGLIDGANQTQTTPSGAPATSPAVNPATGTTPTTNPASPTDYARQGEAAAATVPVTAELQKLNANFTTVPTTDPLVPLSTDVPTFGSTFNNLTRFKLPGHFSACPTPSFNLSNMGMGVYTLDSHCNLLNGNSAPIRNSMIIVFLLSALFIVLRA